MSTIDKLRGPKFADMAIFDWVATGLVAAALGAATGSGVCSTIVIFIILILIAIVVHYAFNIPTMLNAYLGLADKKDVYAKRIS